MKMCEIFIDQTKGHRYGNSGWYEPFTDNLGKLFRSLQQEYGRCTGKVHTDMPNGETISNIGWVFEKRMKYDDARGNHPDRDYYIRKVWVTVDKEIEVR